MRRRPLLLALPVVLAGLLASTSSAASLPGAASLPSAASLPRAAALPVKCAAGDVTADGRVFPEPLVSVGHLRFEDFQCGLALLEAQHGDRLTTTTTGTSKGGLPVYDVLLTDESVTTKKEKLLVVSSIHGDEVPAREGAARVLEDMVDPRFLAGKDWVKEVLKQYVVHFVFPNPDGWANGDVTNGGLAWTRGNDSGRDLNRNFPVKGWIDVGNGTLQEPESQGVTAALQKDPEGWYLGTDNHGQLDDTYAAAGLQIVGEFDYQKSETLARFADGITGSMAQYPVLSQLASAQNATSGDLGPYHWGTLYDMLGYSASGSLIDYYNTADQTDGFGFATELTLGKHLAGNDGVFSAPLAQVWVDSIRAIDYEMFRQAIDRKQFAYPVGSKTAYVHDPRVVTDADGEGYTRAPGETTPQRSYAATRMRFFEDLNEYATQDLTPLTAKQVASGGDLQRFDTLVVADEVLPEPAYRSAYVARLEAFAEQGGTLVVTDAAAPLLAELGLVAPADVRVAKGPVGAVDFTDRALPLNAGLRGVARQTYDVVPIGYSFRTNTAPNWTVTQAAWEAGGGVTAGTNGTGRTVYGEKPLGSGKVRFLGALLPQPTEAYYHPYGLQDYAVTYTGYTLLENMLKR
ncbi:MAG: hypothetical protein JWO60_1885 [Frankiales bacterium]|nr:hypothetical protein [Frankiales bacterium]